jgi:hypothetical protein
LSLRGTIDEQGRDRNGDYPTASVDNIYPRRTIRFVAWMNAEFGASGAATYGKEHVAELGSHIAAMGSDLSCDLAWPRCEDDTHIRRALVQIAVPTETRLGRDEVLMQQRIALQVPTARYNVMTILPIC